LFLHSDKYIWRFDMSEQTHGGKGDRARKVDHDKFSKNFDAIFKQTFKEEIKDVKQSTEVKESKKTT
jgi:hypothetical protein